MSKRNYQRYNTRHYEKFSSRDDIVFPKYEGKVMAFEDSDLRMTVYHIQRHIFVKLFKPRSDRHISLKVHEFKNMCGALKRILEENEKVEEHIKKYVAEGSIQDNYVPEEVEILVPTTVEEQLEQGEEQQDGQTTQKKAKEAETQDY